MERDEWLRIRADVLAGDRAKDLAWAAFLMDLGCPPTHRSVAGLNFIRGHRREGDVWKVIVRRNVTVGVDNTAAVVTVDDRTGACITTFNAAFEWTDEERKQLEFLRWRAQEKVAVPSADDLEEPPPVQQ